MRTNDILKLSVNSLTHRGLRSWLTILGIIIGVAAVVAMLSIGNGMTESVEASLSGFGADIITVSPGYTQAQGSSSGFSPDRMRQMMGFGTEEATSDDDPTLTDRDINALYYAEGVIAVSGSITGRGEVEYLSESVNANIEGIDPVAWSTITTSQLESGRFLGLGDTNSIVVGYSFSNDQESC